MEKYLVTYAKISTDKNNISLQGVYFGGLGDTADEANNIARECVNMSKGSGTIVPKVIKVNAKHAIIDAMIDASEKFEQIVVYMLDANCTIQKSMGKR